MVSQLLMSYFLSLSLNSYIISLIQLTDEHSGAHRLPIVNPTIVHCRIDEHSTYFFTMIHNHKSIKSQAIERDVRVGWFLMDAWLKKKGHTRICSEIDIFICDLPVKIL